MLTKYLYTKKSCSACDEAKAVLRNGSISFVERNGDRLDLDPRIFDEIDVEAFLQLYRQGLTFPIELDIVEK